MLVALHGFTENDLSWREVLGPSGLAVTCPLLPGHGFAACPPEATVSSTASDIAERHFHGQRQDLLGYSMGGRIALVLALEHPQLVRNLVLISSGPGFKDGALQGTRRTYEMALAETLEQDGLGPFVSMWENNPILRPYRPLPRTVEEDLRSRRLQHAPSDLAAALRQLGAGSMPNLWERLGAVRARTLLIAGAADERYVAVMQEMAAAMPDARLAVVPEAGHAIHRERPDEVRRLVVEFLAQRC